VDGEPSAEAVQGDTRSVGQRHHDALKAMGRALLASGQLGQLNGLPCTMIVTTSLQELEAAAGVGVTAGGTLVPMRDVIRRACQVFCVGCLSEMWVVALTDSARCVLGRPA
jgi:hypothetical protein